jgi:hypothetical protein
MDSNSKEETFHTAPSLFDIPTASNTDALDNQPCITLFVLTGFVFILFLEVIIELPEGTFWARYLTNMCTLLSPNPLFKGIHPYFILRMRTSISLLSFRRFTSFDVSVSPK